MNIASPIWLLHSFVLCMLAPATVVRAEERPNVVIVLADDIAWNDYGFMGHRQIATPQLDSLARESVVFTRGYVPTSLCRPSLMSLITGLYPHQHLITGNDPPRGVARAEMLTAIDRTSTIAKQLRDSGYRCLQTGKWWEGSYERGGFTHGMTHGDPRRGGRHGDEGLKIGREGLQPIREFLDSQGESPFFIWYAPMLPHQPHNPPQRLLAKYVDRTPSIHMAKYWAMVEWFDETCGELLGELKQRELETNTVVVFLADNGWIQDTEKPAFAPRSKRSRFEGGLRTPIMIRWPSRLKPARDEESLVSSIDVVPTLLAACNVKPTQDLPGLNLLPAASTGKRVERETLFGAVFEHDIPDLKRAASGLQHRWCLHGAHKLIVPAAGDALELYDVSRDPREDQNLAQQSPEQVRMLRTRLDTWWDGR